MRWMRGLVAAVALLLLAAPALAVEPDEMMADPALEARARAISAGLRCLVCQNQSIDDSSAPLARDLRLIVRERLKAGDSDEAVRRFVVERYGAFVLLRPPLGPATLLLWATPLLALAGAAMMLLRRFSRPASAPAGPAPALTAEEARRVADLVEGDRQPTHIAKN